MVLEKIEDARGRANIYFLLSRVYMKEVDATFLDLLKKPDYIKTLSEHGFAFCNQLRSENDGKVLDELAVEFASLFLITPGRQLSPYESVQTSKEGQLGGEAASRTLLFYKKAGFAAPEGFPDHFAVELEFMGHLCEREASALELSNEETARSERDLQSAFIRSHIGNWYGSFLSSVENSSQHIFYRDFSSFARGFLDSEIEYIESTKRE